MCYVVCCPPASWAGLWQVPHIYPAPTTLQCPSTCYTAFPTLTCRCSCFQSLQAGRCPCPAPICLTSHRPDGHCHFYLHLLRIPLLAKLGFCRPFPTLGFPDPQRILCTAPEIEAIHSSHRVPWAHLDWPPFTLCTAPVHASSTSTLQISMPTQWPQDQSLSKMQQPCS